MCSVCIPWVEQYVPFSQSERVFVSVCFPLHRCMPQGYKSPGEHISFRWMLSNINVLYLSVNVLILLDLSYFSRFWTQYVSHCESQTLGRFER